MVKDIACDVPPSVVRVAILASRRFPEEKEYFAQVAAARKQDNIKALDSLDCKFNR